MDTNEEVRRRRLATLCRDYGGVRVVADRAGINWQSLDQVLKRVLLPAKSDGERRPRSLGDENARKLEKAFGLAPGWLDWPFDGVDFAKWARLDDFQRAFVQGRLDALLEEASGLKVPAGMKRAAVTDDKVEQHYKKPRERAHNH